MCAINKFTLELLGIETSDIPLVLQSVEKLIRSRWAQDSLVDVFSSRNQQWFSGKITQVFIDEVGEWLKIKYNNETCEKEVQRFSQTVRPVTKLSLKHKALDWEPRAVSWWASKQAAPMSKWTHLLLEKNIHGKDLLYLSELSLELIGVPEPDIEGCLKRINDLASDMRMLKKIKRIIPIRFEQIKESSEEEQFPQKTVTMWKQEHAQHGYAWEMLEGERKCEWNNKAANSDEKCFFASLRDLGGDYISYGKLFAAQNVEDETLFEFSKNDLAELGISGLHSLGILLEIEKVKKCETHFLLPWSSNEVTEWIEKHDLLCDIQFVRSQNLNGDLLCMLTKDMLQKDLNFSEATANKFIDLRQELKMERCCFGLLLGRSSIDSIMYEHVRTGRISFGILLKDIKLLNKTEQTILDSISPKFQIEFRDFAKLHTES